jgi:hypothetical protein
MEVFNINFGWVISALLGFLSGSSVVLIVYLLIKQILHERFHRAD